MKKILTLLAALILSAGIAVNAQQREVLTVVNGAHLVKFAVDPLDVIDADGETVIKVFDLNKKNKVQYYTIPVYMDSVAHPGTLSHPIAVLLQQSFDNETWATVTTKSYYASTSDTTFNFQDISTGTSAPWLRVKFGGAEGDSVNINVQDVWGRFLDK